MILQRVLKIYTHSSPSLVILVVGSLSLSITRSRAENSDSSVSSTMGKPSPSQPSVSARRVIGFTRAVEMEVLELTEVEVVVEGKGEDEGDGVEDMDDSEVVVTGLVKTLVGKELLAAII